MPHKLTQRRPRRRERGVMLVIAREFALGDSMRTLARRYALPLRQIENVLRLFVR